MSKSEVVSDTQTASSEQCLQCGSSEMKPGQLDESVVCKDCGLVLRDHTVEEKSFELPKKARLLVELRDYHMKKVIRNEDTIDIVASAPKTKEDVLIRIVTNSQLKQNGVGVTEAEDMNQTLKEMDVNKGIVLGRRFTSAAKTNLKKMDIEQFSLKKEIPFLLEPGDLYIKIMECVNKLCTAKCGFIPKDSSECKGYSKMRVECSYCSGTGSTNGQYRGYRCPICGGLGKTDSHYTCNVRLISDNADFHYNQAWVPLLRQDLVVLLEMLLADEHELLNQGSSGN
jgi:hypothetical protein